MIKNIINKFKSLFKKEEQINIFVPPEQKFSEDKFMSSSFLYANDAVSLCHRAAKMCVGREPIDNSEQAEEHLAKIIKAGHESISEHGNIIIALTIPKTPEFLDMIMELVPHLLYLRTKTLCTENSIIITLAGSPRGYKHIYRNANDMNNTILKYIKEELYKSSKSCLFRDLIDDGIFEDKFVYETYADIELDENDNAIPVFNNDKLIERDRYNIIAYDLLNGVYGDMLYEDDELLDMYTITIVFKGVSRAIANQLVRHRVAITQESQRYVDYSTAKFIDPTKFKPELYDNDKKYTIIGLDGLEYTKTSEDIGKYLMSLYNNFIKQGLRKEDARGFLPLNTETKLVMTFTLRQLLKFFELRTDKAAQVEVRTLALELEKDCLDIMKNEMCISETAIKNALIPKYKLKQKLIEDYENSIDELISEEIID